MSLDSLDPRINRWKLQEKRAADFDSQPLDQLPTYEVFLQLKENKAFEHAGIVHAATPDIAFIFAKEQFSRRYTCTGMWVVPSDRVWATAFTELEENIYYSNVDISTQEEGPEEDYEVFHLIKRGKQHKHVGRVKAIGYHQALQKAKLQVDTDKPVLNVWLLKSADLRISNVEDQVIWSTLNDKTHREVTSYRAGDKLKQFKEKQQPDE